jgi:hypothetical protein
MGTDQRAAVLVHPSRQIFQRTGSITIGLVTLPPFVALYWLTASSGGWPYILAIHAVTVAVVTLATTRIRRVSIAVDEGGIRERGYFGGERFTPAAEVRSAVVVRVLAGSATGSTPHLFVLDGSGRAVLRMRGRFWPPDAMALVEGALDVPVQRPPLPLGQREFRRGFRHNLAFHERHLALTYCTLATACALLATPVFIAINSLL